ncbi:hypothetical protein GCM10009557_11520 [Virgisporangium ochraceum]|uniref:Uncharacterized protein n=1 Tax=Virgisporangium ochraceum TaxID=65505 RepID=A0A8J3ZU18_9ACTN|nr:hypothetical protein [Virgisporangium ochraceum]GIJ69899.1 hypothetical protein Voc01_048160 [Virgisporangium ochraceum]
MDNPTWLEDQRQAAADHAERLSERLGCVGPALSGTLVAPLWERHQAAIRSHQGRDCGHVTQMPRPLYVLARQPGYLFCQPCANGLDFEGMAPRCDLCGNAEPRSGAWYRGVVDFVIFIVGLCRDCADGRPPMALIGASPWPGNRAERRAAARASRRNGA